LLGDESSVLGLVDGLGAVALELAVEVVARLEKLALLLVVLVLDLRQLGLQLLLVHRQRLDLALQHLHSGGGDDGPDVRDHGLGEDFVDEPVVAGEPGVGQVLDGEAVVGVLGVLGLLDVDPPLGRLEQLGLRILDDGGVSRLGLHVALVSRGTLVHRHLLVIFSLLALVLIFKLLFLPFGKFSPHDSDDFVDFPQLQILVFSPDRIPDLLGVPHVRSQRFLRSLGRLLNAGTAHGP